MKYLLLICLFFLTGCGATNVTLQVPKQDIPAVSKDCKDEEDFGYANGLVMAKRVLEEQKMLQEAGMEDDIRTCEEVINDLFNEGYPVASGKFRWPERKE